MTLDNNLPPGTTLEDLDTAMDTCQATQDIDGSWSCDTCGYYHQSEEPMECTND